MFVRRTSAIVATTISIFAGATSVVYSMTEKDENTLDDVPQNCTLRQVIMVHRHGDRSPISRRAGTKIVVEGENDEPDDSEFWKSRLPDSNVVKNLYARFGFTDTDKLVDEDNGSVRGKLTRKGFEELHALGLSLRERYHDRLHFLDSSLCDQNKHLVYLRCTPMSRCVRSELCILSGLFFPSENCTIPIVIGDPNPSSAWYRETMWPSNRMCAYQMDLMRASRKTWRRDDELDALRKRLVDIVGPALGFEEGKRVRLGSTMEVAHCYHRHGKDVPVDEVVVDRLQHLFWQLKVNAFTKTDLPLLRITIGRLLNELFQKMNQAIESPENSPKWCQFSGHDSTMIPLMTSLGLYSAGWPQYGTNVVLELWEMNRVKDSYFVQVFHNGTLQYRMSWSEFCQRMEPLIMSDPSLYESECKERFDRSPRQQIKDILA